MSARKPPPPAPSQRWVDLADGLRQATLPPANPTRAARTVSAPPQPAQARLIADLQRLRSDTSRDFGRMARRSSWLYHRYRLLIGLIRLGRYMRDHWVSLLMLAIAAAFILLLLLAPETVAGVVRAIATWIMELLPDTGAGGPP